MTTARVVLEHLKTLGKFQIFGIICGAYCSIITALVLTVPKLLVLATRLL